VDVVGNALPRRGISDRFGQSVLLARGWLAGCRCFADIQLQGEPKESDGSRVKGTAPERKLNVNLFFYTHGTSWSGQAIRRLFGLYQR
jgi:hypothetical protein